MPGPIDRAGTSASSRCLGARVSAGCQLAGDRVFALERAGGQAQFALVVRSAVDDATPGQVVLDPSELAADAAVAIDWYHPSRDGRFVAYGTSEGGDERSTLRVIDVDTGALLPDEIPDTRAASVGWLPDAGGFLYTRYPEGDEYHRMVYAHSLGTDWHDDPLVWGELPTPESWPDVTVSPDGRWALVHVLVGWGRTDLHLLDRASGTWRTLIEGRDALDVPQLRRRPAGRHHHLRCAAWPGGGGAARCRRCRCRRRRWRRRDWTTLVPEGDAVLDGCRPAGGTLLVTSTRHAVGQLHRYDRRRHAARRDGAARAGIVRRVRRRRRAGAGLLPARVVHPSGRAVPLDARRRPATVGLVSGRGGAAGPGGVRRRAGALPVTRRHRDRAVPRPSGRCDARTRHRRHPQRLRRLRHRVVAGVVPGDRRLVRAGRAVRRGRAARRLRGGRGMAPRRSA